MNKCRTGELTKGHNYWRVTDDLTDFLMRVNRWEHREYKTAGTSGHSQGAKYALIPKGKYAHGGNPSEPAQAGTTVVPPQ